jgi:hypothetical protein
MYNLLNVNNVNFNDEIKPLQGRIDVYIANTTTLATIYAKGQNGNFIETANPVYTIAKGTFPTCLFADQDIDCRYFKYIGSNSDMSVDIDNDDAWEAMDQQYLLKPQFDSQVFNSNLLVHTIAELRALDTSTFTTSVSVMIDGYYVQGDSPVRFYEWLSTSTITEDTGEYIKPNDVSVGRWHLINLETPYIDIRIFGCQPTSSVNSLFECSSEMLNAFAYCNKYSKIVYFANPINGTGVYTFNGQNCVTNFDIYLDDKIKFQAKTGTTSSSITCRNFIKESLNLVDTSAQTGTFTLTANEIRSSWKDENVHDYTILIPRNKVLVDVNSFPLTYLNLTIEFLVAYNKALSLTSCQIISDKKLNNGSYKMSFDKCNFTDRLFSTLNLDSDYLSISECYLASLEGIDSFESVQNYITCGLMNEQIVFNLMGKTISSLTISGSAINRNITLIDGIITALTISNMDQTSFNLDTCEISTLVINDYLFSLDLTNSTINNHLAANIGTINSRNSTYDIYALCANLLDYGSTIKSDMYCSGVIECNESFFQSSNITEWPLTNEYNFLFNKCRFEESKHVLSYDQSSGATVPSGCIVNGRWLQNISEGNSSNFIDLDRSILEPNDALHTYQYIGNEGENVITNKGSIDMEVYISNQNSPTSQPFDAPLLYNGTTTALGGHQTFDLVPWFATSAAYGPWIDYFAVGMSGIEPINCNLKFRVNGDTSTVLGGLFAIETSANLIHGSLCEVSGYGVPSATDTFMLTETNFGGGIWYGSTFPGSESTATTKYPIVITIDK